MVLPFIPGRSLAALVGSTPPDMGRQQRRTMVHLLYRAAEAVQYAHENGVVHRDLKPANIMQVGSTEGLEPRVIDLEACKLGICFLGRTCTTGAR